MSFSYYKERNGRWSPRWTQYFNRNWWSLNSKDNRENSCNFGPHVVYSFIQYIFPECSGTRNWTRCKETIVMANLQFGKGRQINKHRGRLVSQNWTDTGGGHTVRFCWMKEFMNEWINLIHSVFPFKCFICFTNKTFPNK